MLCWSGYFSRTWTVTEWWGNTLPRNLPRTRGRALRVVCPGLGYCSAAMKASAFSTMAVQPPKNGMRWWMSVGLMSMMRW